MGEILGARAEARILDANLDRLAEGLRVIEDVCRFGMNATELAGRVKRLRHGAGELRPMAAAALGRGAEGRGALTSARDSAGDPGRVKIPEPDRRADLTAAVGASFGRVQESARVIEELAKLHDGAMAAAAKRIRYEAYTLETEVVPLLDRRLAAARLRGLYLVISGMGEGAVGLARIAVEEQVAAIQLREKAMESGELLALARRVRAVMEGSGTLFFINDRPDIAALTGADGLHLGQTDLPMAEARRIVGDRVLIGKSTHNLKQMRAALTERPDYVAAGPVFGTQSKERADPALGMEKAGKMAALAGVPAVAIGGIDAGNVGEVRKAGFAAFAVIGAVCRAEDPRAAIRALRRAERAARPPEGRQEAKN